MSDLPAWFTKTLTWDRGLEMVRHASITERTGINVYFADPTAHTSAEATKTSTA